jgi:hypothetical protein
LDEVARVLREQQVIGGEDIDKIAELPGEHAACLAATKTNPP